MKNGSRQYSELGMADLRRMIFEERAHTGKGRWFRRALSGRRGAGAGREAGAGMVFLIFFVLSLWMAFYTGEFDLQQEDAVFHALPGEAAEDCTGKKGEWEREIFGVRIRFCQGQITFFREKEKGFPEGEMIH